MKSKTNHFLYFRKIFKLLPILVIASLFMFGGCGDDSSTAPASTIDSDGDTLSSRTTGISLPQSIQTVPAESTAARSKRTQAAKEGL